MLKELVDKIKTAKAVVFADYRGMSVKDISKMRRELKEKGVEYGVSKKTLIRIAAKEAGFPEIPEEALEGPIAVAFSMKDELAGAKLIYNTSKKNENLKLRGALFEGRVLGVAETKMLAMLPSREELLVKFLYVIKSPIQGFHGVLQGTLSGFVRALKAISEKMPATVAEVAEAVAPVVEATAPVETAPAV